MNLDPERKVVGVGGFELEGGEIEIALLELGVVATDAVRREESADSSRRLRGSERGSQQAQQESGGGLGLHKADVYVNSAGGSKSRGAVMLDAIMLLKIRLLCVAALLGLSTDVAAQNYPAPPFTPPAGHPRVYFTAKDLPRLRANTSKPQNAAAWAAHLKNVQSASDGMLPAKKPNMNQGVLVGIEDLAFDYALNGDTNSGRKAVTAMRNYLSTVTYPAKEYNNTGQTVFTIGIVYDWCYPLTSKEDREFFHQAALKTAALMEIGWPPVKQGNVTGHGPEGQLMRDLMSASIAMYDEYPEMYRMVAGRFFSRMIEPKKFLYPSNMHSQGSHYVNYRGQWEMLCTWLFDRMGLPEVFGPDQKWFMYWSLYARRPDGQMLRDGDTHINNITPGTYYTEPARPFFLAANCFADPYLKAEAMREIPNLQPNTPNRNQSISPMEILVFNNPDLAPKPLAELPLTHYFPSPKGAYIARTSWADGMKSAAAVVEMKINEWYFGNHQHLDAGAFQIYYRGALATDSGYYQAARDVEEAGENNGSTGYGSQHDFNYHKRSIAHNTIQVYDPEERFHIARWKNRPVANDGGQRMPLDWAEPQEQEDTVNPANGYRIGSVLGHGSTADYTYLKGDLTKAYSSKVTEYQRSFVFLDLKDGLHPAALVVFDRVVTANPKLKKAWLLHGLEEPVLSPTGAVFKDTRPGYTGKLTLDTVLPQAEDLVMNAIGGPGKEFLVEGVNYTAALRPNGNNEGGGWRLEVSPKTARGTDLFLNVLQVGDHTPDVAALQVERIDSSTHVGVHIADRVVLFGRSGAPSRADVSFVCRGSGKLKIVVGDLVAGQWLVEGPGGVTQRVDVTAEQGVANFGGAAGTYQLRFVR